MSERSSTLIVIAVVTAAVVVTSLQLAGADFFMEVNPGFFWE